MRIYNGTAHPVKIYDRNVGVSYDAKTRKHYLSGIGRILAMLPQHGMLSVSYEYTEDRIGNIPVIRREVKHIDLLPDGYDYYLVSAQYASHAPDKSKLLIIGEPLYENPDNPRPIGVLSLSFVEA